MLVVILVFYFDSLHVFKMTFSDNLKYVLTCHLSNLILTFEIYVAMLDLDPEDRGRINIKDNVITINYLNDQRDPGMYQCRATNTLKTRYSSAQLRVLAFPPSFKKHPLESETYAAELGNVSIKCNPEAAPRPRFIWKKDGNEIASGGHRRIFKNGNLFISPVSRDDEGVYTCTASNELGVAESRGRLIVLRKFIIFVIIQ